MNPTLMGTEIAQERRLVTEIPGPRSQGLLAKKTEAVSSGVGVGLYWGQGLHGKQNGNDRQVLKQQHFLARLLLLMEIVTFQSAVI